MLIHRKSDRLVVILQDTLELRVLGIRVRSGADEHWHVPQLVLLVRRAVRIELLDAQFECHRPAFTLLFQHLKSTFNEINNVTENKYRIDTSLKSLMLEFSECYLKI